MHVLLIWKQHSPAFRSFFDDLMAGKGPSALNRITQMQKEELQRVLMVCQDPQLRLDTLFQDTFSRNPSFATTLQRWRNGRPLDTFRGVSMERHCRELLGARQDSAYPLYWEFPGGDVDARSGEHPTVSAVREAFEETGYEVVHAPDYGLDEAVKWGRDLANTNNMIVCRLKEGRTPADGPTGRADSVEVRNVRWVPFDVALHMMRDPNNADYPNFLRKVQCHFMHQAFERLRQKPITPAINKQLECMRHTMETVLLTSAQKLRLQDMIADYNLFKSQMPNAPAEQREERKQKMLQFVLQSVQSNASQPSKQTYAGT